MRGHAILSHGLHSSPAATKVSAMADAAEQLGWTSERPDYAEIDARNDVRDVDRRLARLLERVQATSGRFVLAGSSMGAFISALASTQLPDPKQCAGLFLIAPPVALPGYPRRLEAAAVPTRVIHGWQDEVCPVAPVIDWAGARCDRLVLVDDGHRLEQHVAFCAEEFARFLQDLA